MFVLETDFEGASVNTLRLYGRRYTRLIAEDFVAAVLPNDNLTHSVCFSLAKCLMLSKLISLRQLVSLNQMLLNEFAKCDKIEKRFMFIAAVSTFAVKEVIFTHYDGAISVYTVDAVGVRRPYDTNLAYSEVIKGLYNAPKHIIFGIPDDAWFELSDSDEVVTVRVIDRAL